MIHIIYQIVNGQLKPYLSKNGKRFHYRTKEQKRKRTNYMKNNTYYKFYGSYRWKKLAKYIKQRDPICKICLRKYHEGKIPLEKVNLTQSVDHIVKLSDDWSRRFDPSNLEGLCWSCHHKKDGNLFSSRHVKDYK